MTTHPISTGARTLARSMIVAILLPRLAGAAGSSDPADTKPAPAPVRSADSGLRQIEPGVFEIGNVRLDRNSLTVSFPGVVNMDHGPIEYALVSGVGKLHESLLRTEVDPYHIHLAVLLLGTNNAARAAALSDGTDRASRKEQTGERKPFIGKADAPPVHNAIPGEKVSVWVSWKTGQTEKRVRVEDLISNLQTKSPASRGPWIYNGSRLVDRSFLAQRDGSIIAIIEDLDALINNPRPGRENDEIWQVYSTQVPPAGTPTQITIKLEANPDSKVRF